MGGEQHVQAARAIPVRAGSGMKSKVGRQLQVRASLEARLEPADADGPACSGPAPRVPYAVVA